MNTPNKLTMVRILLSILLIILLVFPFETVNVDFGVIRSAVDIDVKYLIGGVVFIIASITDFLDGYLARKNDEVTDTGKMLDAIADKLLVNPILIIFTANGLINPIVPVIVVGRDIIVNSIKMEAVRKGVVVAAINSGKVKTATMMIGMTLLFFSNMPFEIIGIRADLFFIYFATIMSIISLIQYYNLNKKFIFND